MVKYFGSKNGYFYKTINNKNIRISKEEYIKNNKNIKGGRPTRQLRNKPNNSINSFELQNMPKNKITVIFVGASEKIRTNGSRNNKTGQISDLTDFISINPENNTVIAVDPAHGNDELNHLVDRSGISVVKMSNPNDVKPNCLNVSYSESNDFFKGFYPEPRTYYVILVFYGGINREMPSFNVAESIGIENSFFYDIKNALCLGMSCINIPPNIYDFLTNYRFQLENPVVIPEIDQTLQNAFYAIYSDLRALYKTIKQKYGVKSKTQEQILEIFKSLNKINIYTIKEACDYYEHLKQKYGSSSNRRPKDVNQGIFSKLIYKKYEKMGLLPFFKERKSSNCNNNNNHNNHNSNNN